MTFAEQLAATAEKAFEETEEAAQKHELGKARALVLEKFERQAQQAASRGEYSVGVIVTWCAHEWDGCRSRRYKGQTLKLLRDEVANYGFGKWDVRVLDLGYDVSPYGATPRGTWRVRITASWDTLDRSRDAVAPNALPTEPEVTGT